MRQSSKEMKRNIAALCGREYDVIVVGGGIFGVCCAWDAVHRGLSVALVERGDFAQATSANHFKIAHGGVRYLQHADFARIRESSHERSALLRIAPHLTYPLPTVIPTYGHGIKGKEILRAGFFVYDLITGNRNRGIRDPDRRIPSGSFLSRREALELFPGLEKKNLTGGAIFHDAQIYNPPRLVLSFLRSAVNGGGRAANYTEVTQLLREGNRVVGVEARDLVSGAQVRIRAKTVLNATGPWASRLLQTGLGLSMKSQPTFSRDVALVVSRRINSNFALACPIQSKDDDALVDRGGRHLFVMPWRNYTLVGVWHVVYDGAPDKFPVTEKEIENFVREANATYPELGITARDVSMVNSGLILFGKKEQDPKRHSFGRRSLLIDHARTDQIQGLITLTGVRATTARGMAEKAVSLVLKKLGKTKRPSKTALTPIFGGQIVYFEDFINEMVPQRPLDLSPAVIRALAHNYGSEYQRVLSYIDEDLTLSQTVGDSTVLRAEVVHAVREEMAQKLADVVFRRTDLGTGANPGEEALQSCALLMAKELGWDEVQLRNELEEVRTFLGGRGCLKNYNPQVRTQDLIGGNKIAV